MTTMDAITAPIAMVPVPTPAAVVVPAAAPAFAAPASAPVWLNAMDGMNATENNRTYRIPMYFLVRNLIFNKGSLS
jgi:hypothetical protein